MGTNLKTKKGFWGKLGQVSGNPMFPGGYKGYTYYRDSPNEYPTTPQQKKIGEAGRRVGKECEGRKGGEFTACRAEILRDIFG